jgi:hypothetical protein
MGAVLGRAFRLSDVCAIRAKMGETVACEISEASELVAPAIAAGLVTEGGTAGERYLAFSHEQVRAYALDTLSSNRRRQIHAAVLDVLTEGDEPAPESLPVIVRHALAAATPERIARYSLDAARAALAANAPEEALRMVEGRPGGGLATDTARRDAPDPRRRAWARWVDRPERLESITELVALVEAAGDAPSSWMPSCAALRRCVATVVSRLPRKWHAAAQTKAAAAGSADDELRASLELGQDLLRSPLGEGYTPTQSESDFDGAQEAFQRATEIAEQLGAEDKLAMGLRELGVIEMARFRAWFVERVQAGDHIPYVIRIANGESLEQIEKELPIADMVDRSRNLLTRALRAVREGRR